MGTQSKHKEKAEHNEYFVSSIDNPFYDWQVTGIFYAALHWVESYLATKNLHPLNHKLRHDEINRDNFLNQIYVDYRELETQSRDARYRMVTFTKAEVTKLTGTLKVIRDHINPPPPPPPPKPVKVSTVKGK